MLLGVDNGGTTVKAVVFTDDGREAGAVRRATVVEHRAPGWAERRLALARTELHELISQALAAAGVAGSAIDAVGVVGHGDGLYLLGEDGQPSRDAILAIDNRATGVLERWRDDGTETAATAETGQQVFAASPAPLARWLVENEPDVLSRTRWLLSCKDWARHCLTGDVATDLADGSAALSTLDGRSWSTRALELYGLREIEPLLPPLRAATEVAGTVTDAAAAATGLSPGTPVVVGTHDVIATVLGIGAGGLGSASAITGTFGMNVVISADRVLGAQLQSRPLVTPDRWAVMSGSPASAGNFAWFLQRFMAGVDDPLAVAEAEIEAVLRQDSDLVFHPFLYGGPHGQASANLIGLQAHHTRGHVLRAIWEGIAFTHGAHFDDLLGPDSMLHLRLGGGAARSRVWPQLFADALDCEVEVVKSSEPGALGAAMLAGVGVGIFDSVEAAIRRCVRVRDSYAPHVADRDRWRQARERYRETLFPSGRTAECW